MGENRVSHGSKGWAWLKLVGLLGKFPYAHNACGQQTGRIYFLMTDLKLK